MSVQTRNPWDRIAPTYHKDVISPFALAAEFPLRSDICHLAQRWQKDRSLGRRVVVDYGCGCGNALVLAAKYFRFVAGVDLSRGMLDVAEGRLLSEGLEVVRVERDGAKRLAEAIRAFRRARGSGPNRVLLVRADVRRLRGLDGMVDLALGINSICPSRTIDVDRMLGPITASVRAKGVLMLVFPAADAMHYLESLFRQKGKVPEGICTTKEGFLVDSDGLRHKYFDRAEVELLLGGSGIHIQRIEKILYPWSYIARFGWGYFPRRPRIWDWYVLANAR